MEGLNISGIAPQAKENIIKTDNSQPPVKELESSNVEETIDNVTVKEEEERILNEPYYDKRSITIERVASSSLYRKVNSKVISERTDYIGSCCTSSRVLASNEKECAKYFPNIIGISANHPDFVNRVKIWLNNICVPVKAIGLTLNTSFKYDHYRDYLKIKEKEDYIESAYSKADKSTLEGLKKAISDRITALNFLETSKHQYGMPDNVEQYLIYRHCLLYKDVCKDLSLINSDSTIRFYIKDEDREKERMIKTQREINIAKRNYLAMLADDEMFDSMFVQYCVFNNYAIGNYENIDRFNKEQMLDDFSRQEPAKFNKYFTDRNLKTKVLIERLISKGELVRSDMNQNISTIDGEFIGANMKEAVMYFNNPSNAAYRTALENKLKL